MLIVGSGQSGCEIGLELLETGRHVHLAVGRCGWFPRRYRGRELMRWMVDVGASDETPDVLRRPRRAPPGTSRSRAHAADATATLSFSSGPAHDLYGRLEGFDAGARYSRRPRGRARVRTYLRAQPRRRCDEWAAREQGSSYRPPSEAERPPRRSRSDGARTRSRGRSRTVLWAGGFRPAFSWIDLPIFDELGFPRAARGVTDIPGLAFVGLPWLHKRKSPLLLGVGDDAAHVAERSRRTSRRPSAPPQTAAARCSDRLLDGEDALHARRGVTRNGAEIRVLALREDHLQRL